MHVKSLVVCIVLLVHQPKPYHSSGFCLLGGATYALHFVIYI
jgi:hypothetical protein